MRRLILGLLTASLLLALAAPAHAIDCDGIALGSGCLFTATGGDTLEPNDGFAVTNAAGVPMWAFVRNRSLQAIGYPISQRWVEGPFTLQAFQKVILQWSPGEGRINYYNTLDVLANKYPEVRLPNVPEHQVLDTAGLSFSQVKDVHLSILDRNSKIKAAFLAEPDWLNLFGLPIRYEEREVNGNPQGLQLLRAQRIVFEIWNVPAPGTTPGAVGRQNIPDKVKRLANVIVPDAVKFPVTASVVASLPAYTLPTPTPAATPPPAEPPAAAGPAPQTLYETDRAECRPIGKAGPGTVAEIRASSVDFFTNVRTNWNIAAQLNISGSGGSEVIYFGPHAYLGKGSRFTWIRHRPGEGWTVAEQEQHATGIPGDRTLYNIGLRFENGSIALFLNGAVKHAEIGLPYSSITLRIGCFALAERDDPHVTFQGLRVTGY